MKKLSVLLLVSCCFMNSVWAADASRVNKDGALAQLRAGALPKVVAVVGGTAAVFGAKKAFEELPAYITVPAATAAFLYVGSHSPIRSTGAIGNVADQAAKKTRAAVVKNELIAGAVTGAVGCGLTKVAGWTWQQFGNAVGCAAVGGAVGLALHRRLNRPATNVR